MTDDKVAVGTPRCDCESTITDEYTAEAEVLEGPRRGEIATINIQYCTDCGGLVKVQLPIKGVPVDAA